MLACYGGYFEIFKLLYELPGVDVNTINNSKSTLVTTAATATKAGSEAIIDYLINNNASVTHTDNDNMDALIITANKGNKACMKLLLSRANEINFNLKSTKKGQSALLACIERLVLSLSLLTLTLLLPSLLGMT